MHVVMAVVVVVLPLLPLLSWLLLPPSLLLLLLDVVEVVRALVCELSNWLRPTCTAER